MASTYRVERRVHVDAPPSAVQERVADLHRWTSWSPWEGLDPEQRRMYGGPSEGVGAWYEWQGNRKAGQGRMEVIEADDSHVTIDLRFVRPFRSRSTTVFTFVPEAEGTLVTWTMTGEKTSVQRVLGVVLSMDKLLGGDFEKGLANLKAEAEAATGPDASGDAPAVP